MQPRSVLLACSIVLSLAVGLVGAQRASSEREIRLRFSDRVNLTGLSIRYFIEGPFGGFGDVLGGERGVREYAMQTWRDGKQATSLKAIIYCPGYAFELLLESSLPLRRIGVVSVDLKPLRWLPMAGRVMMPPDAEPMTIEAVYSANWSHEFFGIIDGAVASFTVAKSAVGPGGHFALEVPDLVSEPVVAALPEGWRRGALRLIIRGAQTGNIWPPIKESGQAGHEIPLSSKYPQDLLLPIARRFP